MKFYTSVLPYKGRLLVRGVNHDGSHKKFKVNYKPSLFVPVQKETGYKTLDGRNVEKVQHESMYETEFTLDDREDRTPILFDREFMSRVNVMVNPDRKYVVTTKYSLD